MVNMPLGLIPSNNSNYNNDYWDLLTTYAYPLCYSTCHYILLRSSTIIEVVKGLFQAQTSPMVQYHCCNSMTFQLQMTKNYIKSNNMVFSFQEPYVKVLKQC